MLPLPSLNVVLTVALQHLIIIISQMHSLHHIQNVQLVIVNVDFVVWSLFTIFWYVCIVHIFVLVCLCCTTHPFTFFYY